MFEYEVFPAKRTWPNTSLNDIAGVPPETTTLRLGSKALNFSTLQTLVNLTDLWCLNVGENELATIAKCVGIRRLFIDGLKGKDLEQLNLLESLEILYLERNSKVTNLSPLRNCSSLKGLGIVNFKNLHSIVELAGMKDLRKVVVEGGMWTRRTIDTLAPLSGLSKLEELDLANVKVADNSLKALEPLRQLRELTVANFFPTEEFAWLSTRLTKTKCTWFMPYIDLEYSACKKCGKNKMVMLSGRGTSSLCKACDSTKLARHIEKFNNAANS